MSITSHPFYCLVDLDGGAHRRLDVERLDVLPLLLKQGDQEVDRELDVLVQLLSGHVDVANCNTHAQHLLQLELDGCLKLINLGLDIVVVGDGGRELACLGQTRTQNTRNLLDQRLGCKERIILLGYRGKSRLESRTL